MELRSEQGTSLPLQTNTGEEQQTEHRPCRESAQQSSTHAGRRRPFRRLRAHVRLLFRRRRNINADPKETTRILNSKTRDDGLATTRGNNDTNMSPPTETEGAATTTNMAAAVNDVGTFTECIYFSAESQTEITTNTGSETESDLQSTIPRSESISSLDETETSSSSGSVYFSSDSWTDRKIAGDCVTISENQSEDTNDNVPTTISLTEAPTGTDDMPTTLGQIEATTSTDDMPTSEGQTEATTGTDDMPTTVGKTEATTSTDNMPTSEGQTEATTSTDDMPTTIGLIEATTGTDDMPTSEGQTEATTSTDGMPTAVGQTEATTGTDNMPTSEGQTKAITGADEISSTLGQAEATTGTDDMPTSEGQTEATTDTNNMTTSEGQTEVTTSTGNMSTSEGDVLPPTSHKEPAEDKSHPSRTSVQPAQQSSTPAGTYSLLKRVRDFFRPLLCCCKNRRKGPERAHARLLFRRRRRVNADPKGIRIQSNNTKENGPATAGRAEATSIEQPVTNPVGGSKIINIVPSPTDDNKATTTKTRSEDVNFSAKSDILTTTDSDPSSIDKSETTSSSNYLSMESLSGVTPTKDGEDNSESQRETTSDKDSILTTESQNASNVNHEQPRESRTKATTNVDNATNCAIFLQTPQETSAEDKPHPSRTSVQHAQHSTTTADKHRSLKLRDFLGSLFRRRTKKSDFPTTLTGKVFNYHQFLGEGTYGKVYLASHSAFDKPLAVKLAEKAKLPVHRQRIERQAMEMVESSRFFPKLYGSFQTEKYLAYVLEYVNGGNLHQFIFKRMPLDNDTIRFIAAELLCGIKFLHSQGIVHNDLKANNVLLDSSGHVKIADFGLSKIIKNSYCPDTEYSDYEQDYGGFRFVLVQMSIGRFRSNFNDSQLQHLIMECRETAKYPYVGKHLQKHPFFKEINWADMEAGNVNPPYIMTSPTDQPLKEKVKLSTKDTKHAAISDVRGFDFFDGQLRDL